MKKILIAFSLVLIFTSCEDVTKTRMKEVDGHVYLRKDGTFEFYHDPHCGRCKEIDKGINREVTMEIQ